jgi:hypothetical protein
MPPDLTRIEEQLRDAYLDAADSVRQADLRPAPAVPRTSGFARIRLAIPVTATAAVLLVFGLAMLIAQFGPLGRLGQAKPHGSPGASTRSVPGELAGSPRFTLSVAPNAAVLEVRDAVTATLTGETGVPKPDNSWNSVAAIGRRTFLAVAVAPGDPSVVYRISVNALGAVSDVRRIAVLHNTSVQGATVSPDGTWLGYLNVYNPRHRAIQLFVVLENLRTGKTFQWQVPLTAEILGLSIDAAGDELAVSALFNAGQGVLAQHTYVLRPGAAGTDLTKLRPISDRAGPLVLSPDGRTLYEVVQTGGIVTSVLAPATFELEAIDAVTGHVTAVLHSWHTTSQAFFPVLAADPAGAHLLIINKTVMAAVNLRTGHYTRLRAPFTPPLDTQPPLESDGQQLISLLAW